MKTQGLLASVGFGTAVVVLYLYASRAHDAAGQSTIVLAALAAWWLESQAVDRRPVDFSAGFLFYLMLGLSGDALGAALVMLAGYCVRELSGKAHVGDLLWLSPVIALLALAQTSESWPTGALARVGVAALGSLMAAAAMEVGSRLVTQRLSQSSGHLSEAHLEARQRTLRRMLLLYAPVAGVLLPQQAWLFTLVAPLCWALQRSAENIGYRVHAQDAVLMKHRVEESMQRLEETQTRLAKSSERQGILEEMTGIFARPLTPSQAFRELARVTGDVVPYRSVVLFKINDGGDLEPSFQDSPESDLLEQSLLVGRREPLVEKAWLHERAYRGTASSTPGNRLLAQESQLVAIPLKPAGVLYFGRPGQPFSKAEASRLFFVVRRAAPALLRAEQDAANEHALAQQSQASVLLREKVALTSRLLEGAQEILSAVRPEQIYLALERLLAKALPHQFGVILVSDRLEKARHWGQSQVDEEALRTLASLVRQDGRPLYLPDMTSGRLLSPSAGVDSVLVAPLFGEQQFLGVIVLGARGRQAFSDEQHDFVYTCACLAGSGLTSLALFSRLQSAHQQVVQASKLSAIGRLAATVAHELNTPLAAIGLAIEAVALRPEKAGDKLDRAGKALDRAQEIVSGLLAHARHSGSERSLISVEELFQGVIDLVVPQLARRPVQVDVECAEIADLVLANMTDLQQVLINLLFNAADASQPGSRILLFARQEGSCIEMGVRDWGTGIAAEHREKLFDPFFTTKAAGLGTGLGLSVCRQLVDRHQGELDLLTAPGQGSTFTASFPARQRNMEALRF